VPLSLQSRQVGDITVVACSGRIVDGPEAAVLQQQLTELLPDRRYLVLDLAGVNYIDSSGLGLLVRLLMRIQNVHGHLKLCAVQANIGEVLRVTRLGTIFESHDTNAEAVAAFYQGAAAPRAPYRFDPVDILCVEKSLDVLAFVRELLVQAGYGVMTTDNLPDALTLLQATQPKLLVIGAELRAARATQTAERFNELANAVLRVELPRDFSSVDAGGAADYVLAEVRAMMGDSGSRVTGV
jgi:anti-sigma B factor antagonist